METWAWITLSGLALFLIILLIFGAWVLFLSKPHIGVDCKKSGWVWSDDCLYFQEKFFDSNLKDPSHLRPYLVKFSDVDGAGPPVCLPMWYCFRYVNVKTGGYSKFSQWTEAPVHAGADTLPCVDGVGKCNKNYVPQGGQTCGFNQPVIGVPNLQYSPLKQEPGDTFIYANIHRWVGQSGDVKPPGPPETTKTEIIGYFIPSKTVPGIKFAWNDVQFNPCEDGGPGCGRCLGC